MWSALHLEGEYAYGASLDGTVMEMFIQFLFSVIEKYTVGWGVETCPIWKIKYQKLIMQCPEKWWCHTSGRILFCTATEYKAPAALEGVNSVVVLMVSLLCLADKNGDLNKDLKLNQIL